MNSFYLDTCFSHVSTDPWRSRISLKCKRSLNFVITSRLLESAWLYLVWSHPLPGQKWSPTRKRSETLTFSWTTFSSEDRDCDFKLLQRHKIDFRPVLHSCFTKTLYWWWESPLFPNLSPMNPGIVILEHAVTSVKIKIHYCNNPLLQYIQVVSWPHSWATWCC